MRAYQAHIFIFLMSSSANFTRPKFDWEAFEERLEKYGKVVVKLLKIYCLDIKVDASQRFFAYFGTNDKMLVDNRVKDSFRVTFEIPLYTGHSCSRVSGDALRNDFFMLPMDASMNFKPRISTDFLRPEKKVQTTEKTQFWYMPDKAWSPEFEKGKKFKVVGRDDDTAEIMLEPEGGGRIIQLHLTNARFFEEVIEKSPEHLPANDGVGKSEVEDLKALLREQSQLLIFQEKQYQGLLDTYKTFLTARISQGTGACEFQEQAQLLELQTERYQKLFTRHQRFVQQRITQEAGASESLPSSIIQHMLPICPFLADTPEPSDTGVLQNGQLVSRSSWDTYVSKLPKDTTPLCPLTREEITQKEVITCRPLQFLIERLQSINNEQQKRSADVHRDEGASRAKRPKL